MSISTLDVLPEVGSWRAAEAGTDTIYKGEGANLSALIRRRSRQANPNYPRLLLEAAELYRDVLRGSRRAALTFTEAMSTSDFQLLFGDIIDRQLLANYQLRQTQWRQVARRGTVRDFRTVKRFILNGGQAVLDEVKQTEEYDAAKLTDGDYTYAVKKFGRRLPLSWETLINDDLDAFRDLPQRLGAAAAMSEDKFWTTLFASSAGPNSTFFSSGNGNVVASNPTLSMSGLQAGMNTLAAQKDSDGNPIYIEAMYLVVPPALEVTANNILNATELIAATGGGPGTGQDQLRVQNWMQNRVRPVVNPWLPIVDTTHGGTAWYLFADPGAGRPSMEVGFLMGHEQPELFQKSPNALRVGGGLAAPEDGSFETDTVDWKVRHVFGGTLMDPKVAVASNGSGT